MAVVAGALFAAGATLAATTGTTASAGHPALGSSAGWFYLD